MGKFDDAIILVTGAASGIGAATAQALAGDGAAELILMDRERDALARVAAALPCPVRTLVGDVADEALWAGAPLDGLTHAVVNAGIADGRMIADTSLADWRRVMAVNLDGAFLTLKAAMAAMGLRGGAIVVNASVAGIKAEPSIGAYGASKAGLLHLVRIAAKEGAPQGIRVNAVAPGGVETPIWRGIPFFDALAADKGEAGAFAAMAGMATPLGRYARPDEIAGMILFLASADAAYLTGSILIADGGYAL